MKFTIRFHGPFRVATGHAGNGADDVVNPECPLPGSSLKGLFRASAASLLGSSRGAVHLLDDIFGRPGKGAAWAWTQARLAGHGPGLTPIQRARVAIEPETHTARPHSLLFAEELWPEDASFEVEPIVPLTSDLRERHALVLQAAGCAIHSIGADRRRGLGWVTIRPETEPGREVVFIDSFLRLRAELPS